MTEIEFINAVDSCGNLFDAFEQGIVPTDCKAGRLRDIVEDAYDAFGPWSIAHNDFYDYVETCAFEED